MKRLLAITTPTYFPEEAKLLVRLFNAGLQTLHLRKPEADKHELSGLLDQISAEYHPRIVLHDHPELAREFAVGGIHLNRRNPEPPTNFSGTISRSCHTLEELKQYKDLDYLFLSPIFPSISKEGYGSGFPLETLKRAADAGLINERIIALGGMDAQTIPQLRDIPFGGYAVLGALWGKRSPAQEQDAVEKRLIHLIYTVVQL